ncbi:efflux RND transporter periplasmic adaptor subunit [Benzoatithermus flavus]|uniref:Efflux RND transporter periplasmic adaptor subunit n=1 Tax=Benzoatithermus flavus TaxID=3108223 RepID=A0ABU8XTQ4_9PROT
MRPNSPAHRADPAKAASHHYEDSGRRPHDAERRATRKGLVIRLILVALLVGGVGGGLWYFNEFRKQAIRSFFANNVPPPTAVAAVPAEQGPLPRYLGGIGTLVAVRQVSVSPEVQGRVAAIHFEPGAVVKQGEPLVQLNDAPEQADLASFKAQARLAQANLDRTRQLARSDFATQAALDQNQALLEQAQAGIARSEALIAQKLVKAPFAGQLGIRRVELGQYVGPGTELVTLTDLDRLYVNFTVPEQARAVIRLGQPVEITIDAYPGRVFKAELTTIEPQIDPSTRTIKLQATMANPDRLLLPGMFANARLVLPPVPDVVTVPETAVTRTLYGDSVFVVREEGVDKDGRPVRKAVQTFVRTGDVVGGRIAILEGVKPGELVVASGQLKLQSGAAVRVVADNALPIPAEPPVE